MQSAYVEDDQHGDAASLIPELPSGVEAQSSADINNDLASGKPSIISRMFWAVARFSIAILIGVGATLAWQSNSTSLRWLSVSTTPDVERSAQNAAVPQSASLPLTASPVAESIPELAQLGPMTQDLAAMRLSLEQLAVKQDQIIQNMTALQTAQQDIKQKISSRAVFQLPSDQPHKPPKPRQQSAQSPPVSAVPPVAQSPAQ